MKKLVVFAVITLASTLTFAQNIGINDDGSIPDSTAILDIKSSTSGLLIPRLTTAERTTIAAPAKGLIVLDTPSYVFWIYDGTAWNAHNDGNGIYNGDGTVPAGTDAAITDYLNFDANTLYIDGTNNRVGIGTATPSAKLEVSGWIGRTAHNNGALVGSYNNIGENSTASNPIYSIGSSYLPGTATLGNLYGVGYTSTNASFISSSYGSGWGLYVAADGDARWFANGSSGNTYQTGNLYVSTGNVTGGGMYLSDDGGLFDRNDGYGTMAFSGGVDFEDYQDANDHMILTFNDSYPEIWGYRNGVVTLMEFRTGIFNNGGTFYSQNQMYARSGIANDAADLMLNDNVDITGDLTLTNGIINSAGDHLRFMYGVRGDDASYEWQGFYSGTTRQGIVLYDGVWAGANNLANEFSITAENNNHLSLNTGDGEHVLLMPKGTGNVGINQLSPSAKLDVVGTTELNGSVAIIDGTEAAGRVLTSDASGNAHWGAAPKVYYASGTGSCNNSMADNGTYCTLLTQNFTTTAASSTVVLDFGMAMTSGACSGINAGGSIVLDGAVVTNGNYLANNGAYATVALPLKYSTTVAAGAHTVEIRFYKMWTGNCSVSTAAPGSLVTTVYE